MTDEPDNLPEVQHATPRPTAAETRRARQEAMRQAARDRFDGLVTKAIATVEELCEMGDSESVRLEAAKTILKMAEVDPSVGKGEGSHDDKAAIRDELQRTLDQLARNNPSVVAALTETSSQVVDAEVIEDPPQEGV